jgi:hypothetical protein
VNQQVGLVVPEEQVVLADQVVLVSAQNKVFLLLKLVRGHMLADWY